jgi:hypothetical protein
MTAYACAREGEPANPLPTPTKIIPRLPAYLFTVDGQPGLRVFCRWCDRWHIHGGYGHRVAHCHISTSPYRLTGYVLVHPGESPES